MKDYEIMLAKANGTERQAYEEEVNKQLIAKYPGGGEIAILRKAIKKLYELTKKTPSEEFMDYYNEAEGIKAALKAELQIGEEEAQE